VPPRKPTVWRLLCPGLMPVLRPLQPVSLPPAQNVFLVLSRLTPPNCPDHRRPAHPQRHSYPAGAHTYQMELGRSLDNPLIDGTVGNSGDPDAGRYLPRGSNWLRWGTPASAPKARTRTRILIAVRNLLFAVVDANGPSSECHSRHADMLSRYPKRDRSA
jgi:hypothetical protein